MRLSALYVQHSTPVMFHIFIFIHVIEILKTFKGNIHYKLLKQD